MAEDGGKNRQSIEQVWGNGHDGFEGLAAVKDEDAGDLRSVYDIGTAI